MIAVRGENRASVYRVWRVDMPYVPTPVCGGRIDEWNNCRTVSGRMRDRVSHIILCTYAIHNDFPPNQLDLKSGCTSHRNCQFGFGFGKKNG